MVNWCPATQTALSDEEVEMKSQKGFMYHFKVEVVDSIPRSSRGNEDRDEKSEVRSPKSEIDRSLLTSAATEEKKAGPEIDSESRTWLTIATTRPETIPGDTAVAVNPKDTRYAHLIGKHIVRPLPHELPREQKLIPIIGDEHVDFEFGTGVLKVTPAHDKADFDIGQRHNLPIVDIMNPDATMNALAGGPLAGLDRFKARKVATELLREQGALVDEKPYENNIGFSQRADVPIEPRLSEQWFLKYPAVEQSKACVEQEEMGSARASRAAVSALANGSSDERSSASSSSSPEDAADGASTAAREGACAPRKMRFHPQRWAKVYDHWLTNIQDWCISRQLWWGHRIPVWTVKTRLEKGYISNEAAAGLACVLQKDRKDTVVNLIKEDASPLNVELWREDLPPWEYSDYTGELEIQVLLEAPDASLEKELSDCGFTQDPDVLDTWFSSWLWPFATMGWPEQTETLKKFYPTTDLVTGPDIIFFWVARMIMAGYEFMGEPKFGLSDAMPFRNVYFTGIIRDKQGRKMSKTLGNSPDPLELIAKYGADALRFGTMRSAPLGQDVLFDEKDVELGRNFCNKLWNACRFRQMQGSAPASGATADAPSAVFEVQGEINPQLLTTDDKWILLKLDHAIREITDAFAEYKFNEATATLYRFFWSEYCDWYVEASKAVLSSSSRGNEARDEKSEVRSPKSESQSLLTSAATDARKANTIAVIDFVLSHTLRLFHPFLPFITEELWHDMGYSEDMPENQGGKTIMNALWPRTLDEDFKGHYGLDDCYLQMVDAKYDLVTRGRNLRREANIPPNKKVKFVFKPSGTLSKHDAQVLKLLLNAEAFEVNADYQAPKGTPAVRAEMGELFLPLDGLRSAEDIAAEKTRLSKEVEKIQAEITKVEQKLNNPAFIQKVPPAVLAEHQKRLADWQAKLEHVRKALDGLQN
jgi:valyl-tRNA synthetase